MMKAIETLLIDAFQVTLPLQEHQSVIVNIRLIRIFLFIFHFGNLKIAKALLIKDEQYKAFI